jgi:hypothetical protein
MTTCPENTASERWKNNNDILIIESLITFLKTKMEP